MRVYEFSRQYGISSKDIEELLEGAALPVSGQTATLSDKQLKFLHAHLRDLAQRDGSNARIAAISSIIPGPMSLDEAAQKTGRTVGEVVLSLLRAGVICNKNAVLPESVVRKLAQLYDIPIEEPAKKEDTLLEPLLGDNANKGQLRPPVVVVMGHVDHGKTTLLDFIRRTRVAAKEKGGITQHLGAYSVETSHGPIVFLDTPGHEAFSKMRMRGARVADIAILIIAADDGVMPQTVEAIRHAKAAGLQIVVAINKVDKSGGAGVEKIKQQLTQHEVLVEDWGGDAPCVPISAKSGQGVEQLLEVVALQAEVMELRADPSAPVQGYVLESQLERGLGPVGTVILQAGTLHAGDYFDAGGISGRVGLIVNSAGGRLKEVGPAVPVRITGFDELAEAGSLFKVITSTEHRKLRSLKGARPAAQNAIATAQEAIELIIKTDTKSTREALLDLINKMVNEEGRAQFHVVHAGIGAISEGDVLLAATTGARIIGLHVKFEPRAAVLAQDSAIKSNLFDIIYEVVDELERARFVESVKLVEKKTGTAEVRRVFNVKGVGVIAGVYVKDGQFVREGSVKAYRNGALIGSGKIKSFQRDKKPIKVVAAGFECAFITDGFAGWQEGDTAECVIETAA